MTKPAFGFTGGYLATGGPVLNTTGSFMASAWVRLADTNDWHTAVSQDGDANSAFYLQYDPQDNGAWASHGSLAVGRALYGGALSDFFAGQISDVRVSDIALMATQIAAVYAGTAQITQLS